MKSVLLFFPALLLSVFQDPGSPAFLLPEIGLEITLPSNVWKAGGRRNPEGIVLYSFKREPITDSLNRGIVANLSILIESVPKGKSERAYARERREKVPYQTLKILNKETGHLRYPASIGYDGRYSDSQGIVHRIRMVYAVRGSKALQLICDATETVWPQLEQEFRFITLSLQKPVPVKQVR